MKLYIIAGEPSGDLHASNLVRSIKNLDRSASVRGFGGDRMQAAGAEIVKHYKDLAFMGFLEVVVHLRTILRNLSFCKKDILQFKPDAVILVDYPGFNLRIAKFLKQNARLNEAGQGIKVFYYISPKVWAWHSSRVKQIKECVDRMFVILPFEKEFYAKWNYDVDFVGHPLLDALDEFESSSKNSTDDTLSFEPVPFAGEGRGEAIKKAPHSGGTAPSNFLQQNQLEQKRIIAILPGSREQEIKRMLPVMAEMVQYFPDERFVVAGLSQIGESFYRQYLHHPGVKLVMDQTYDVLNNSFAAVVTSGTATLEAALFNVPQVVCYKANFISYWIGRMLVKVKFIALVNLIGGREIVEELIQNKLTAESLRAALNKISGARERERILSDYKSLREKLGGAGASKRAAEEMVKRLIG